MKYYSVKFTFDIPVAVPDEEGTDIDAYYAARQLFPNYNINEASVKIDAISESVYNNEKQIERRLHVNDSK